MKQDSMNVIIGLLTVVMGVLVCVFLLFIAVGGKQVDYGGLSAPIMDGYSFVDEPIELNIDCNTAGLVMEHCLSRYQYKMWNGEHYELQPAVGINKYQNTSRVSLQPQGFEGR